MKKIDDSGGGRRRVLRAGLSALAAGLLLKLVGSDRVLVERVYAPDGSTLFIGQGNTGSSTTTLSSPVTGGPAAFFDNAGGTGDAQAIQGRITGVSGRAFVGFAQAASGSTIALDGVNNSATGIALRGANTAATGDAVGVQGSTESILGFMFRGKGPGAGDRFWANGNGVVRCRELDIFFPSLDEASSPGWRIGTIGDNTLTFVNSIIGGGGANRVNFDPNGNVGIRTFSFGSGIGVIGIGNSNTAPTTNPVNGGVFYVEAGALKYRGSGGTVTTLALA